MQLLKYKSLKLSQTFHENWRYKLVHSFEKQINKSLMKCVFKELFVKHSIWLFAKNLSFCHQNSRNIVIVMGLTDISRHLDYSFNVSMSLGKVHSPERCLALPVLGAGLEDTSRTLSLSSDNSAHFSTIHKYSILVSKHASGLKIFISIPKGQNSIHHAN